MSNLIRVFIISETPLIDGNLSHFLETEPEIEVVGEEMSVLAAFPRIKASKPHVIFWADSKLRDNQRQILWLLTVISGLKIIHLDLQTHTTKLYRSDHIKIRNVQDLLRLIKGDWAEQSQPDVELD